MLAQTRFQILVLPDRMQHEANALRLGSREEHDTLRDHAVAREGRGPIEEHEIEPVASHLPPERGRQAPDRVLDRGGLDHALVVQEHGDIDVALVPFPTLRPASVQIGETHRGIGTQTSRETLAEAAEVFLVGVVSHARPSFECPFTPALSNANQG